LLSAVQYITILYCYLRKWWKNPHCSFSCCLALLLPLNDLQGKIDGLAGANVLNNQMQTGHLDAPTLIGAMKDSGAMDVSLEEGEQDDCATFAGQEENCQGAVFNKTQSHKNTQTEMFTLSIAVKKARF